MPLSSHVVPKLKDPSLFREAAFINGQFVQAKDGKTFDVHDPASTDKIATIPELSVSEVRDVINIAQDALNSFRKTLPRERARMLRKWYELIMENQEDLATIITWENGKPLADARGEVAYAAAFFEWFSEEAPRMYGDNIPASVRGNRVVTVKQPVGVCGLITPWNFPAAMITRKIGPALAAGCTVVAKAPSETPLTSLAIAELANRAGIPKGVVNIVTTLNNTPEIGKELCTNPIIKKVSFTGSTSVGKLLMQQCSSTLKKLSFELGGNAPFIVFDDADLGKAVAGAITSKFRSSGQTCVCANRIYVQEAVYDEFSKRLAEKVKGFKVGSGYHLENTHGPLIHERAVGKVQDHVEDALKKGGTVLVGGKGLDHLGPNFYEPTVITNMTSDMRIHREETFGPIAALFRFKSEKEVVDLANEAEVGLAGYFFSSDIARIWRVAEALEVGMVGVNTGSISDAASPFGGVKESGFGREGSKYGIDEYTVIKSITFGGIGELQE
ncbi:succinic semialdehyde dehydrogenase [Choiromyces venosus 120613-1]|uniref:Succinate-semialdehyde dehydrogenase n=1 Tax=Choiromyces venosus 120613-1 TaxID=1336337 RepID=A0A3N4J7E8_9PEZI|nr:succinic semialdehyde dehydrogenase [Choiromyces venosus 120613-1]